MLKTLLIKQRHGNWQKSFFLLPFFILALSVVSLLAIHTTSAGAATSSSLNFQGRLLTNTGGLVPDGSYNFDFNLYGVDTGGASLWTETHATATVSNGYYSVELGSVTAFPGTIPWDQELWLGMDVNSDGEMTPRFKLTAVPYAFRAGAVVDAAGNAFTGDDLAQLAPATIQPVTAAVAALRINQAGTGDLLQLQGGGSDVFTVDNAGEVTLGAGITVGNSTTATAGTIRWSGTDLEVFDGASWVSLTSGGGGGGTGTSGGITVVKTADETINSLTALQDDNDLKFSIEPNDTVSFRFTLQGTSGTTPDFRFAVTAPFGATCAVGAFDHEGATSTGNLGCGASSTRIAGSGFDDVYEIAGTVTNGTNAGDVTLQWAQFTSDVGNTTVRAGSSVFAIVESTPGVSTTFDQGGNAFGAVGTLGTTDGFGLDVVSGGVTALSFTSTGAATFNNGLTLSTGNFDLTTGEIQNAGNITGAGALTVASGGAGDLTLDSASDVLIIADDTLRRSAAGTTTIDLLDASGATTLSLLNSDAGQVAGLTVEGDVTANAFSGDGSALTSLNGTNITSGTVADARLSTNVALLDAAQTFTSLQNFSGALTVGNTADTTAGNIRWTGTDLEVFDGAAWVSLTSGGSTTPNDFISETIDNNSTASAALYDVFDAANYGTFSSTQNAANGIVYTSADGRFTIANDGTYNINTSLLLENSANSLMNIIVRVNGVDVYNNDTFIHSAVDPVERSITLVQDLSATDFVEVLVDGVNNITVHGGSTINIVPVSSAGGTGGGGGGVEFVQGGNAFGAAALLGTTDTNGLDIIIDSAAALQFTNTGAATFTNGLTVSSGSLSVDSGVIDAAAGLTISSGGAGDLTLDSASDTLILSDATLQRSGAGATTIDLFDASGGTTLSLVNSNAGQAAGLTVEGDVTGTSFSGDGSALTSLNGTNIVSGTIDDARLSTNIALLDTDQAFTGQPTFNSGVILGNTATATAGAVRWTGTDFEGFDGTDWVSLSDSGGDTINVVKLADETVTSVAALQDDDHLFFDVGENQTWSFNFVLQAQSGTTPDFRFAVTAPAGSTCVIGAGDYEGATSRGNLGCGVTTTRIAGSNTNELYEVSGTVQTGATAGQIRLQWAQFTANATSAIVRAGSYVTAVEENGGSGGSGGGGGGTSFDQGGNAFGAGGILGTTDGFGLDIVTGGTTALAFTSVGAATLNNGLTITAGDLSVDSGVINASAGLAISSGGAGDLSLDSASDTLVLNDSTLRRTAAGTTTLDLLDVGADTTFSILNSDGTQTAGLLVEGDLSASTLAGNGAGLTNLNGTAITSGTIPNARLSATVALTDTAQTYTGIPTFNSGLIAGNSASTTAGAIRWNGTDLEGFDGASWVSLTSGGGSSGDSGNFISQTIDNNSNASAAVYDVFEAGNYGTFSSTENARDGIVFTSADGRFTVPEDGTYNINLSLIVQSSANGLVNTIVRVNGVNVFNNDSFIHSVVDPVERSITLVQDLSANDFVEVLVDGASNITVHGGTTLNIVPVSAVGGGGLLSFNNGGNAFGAGAVLGTTDTFGLSIITDGAASIVVSAAGEATFSNDTFFNGKLILGSPPSPDALAQSVVFTGAAANKGLVVQGTTSQTANLFELQDNSGTTLSGFDAAGALVLGLSTVDSSASVARAVSLPDEAGTICLSGADSCGFLALAAGSTYTDATSNDVLSINKTSGTGELLDFQRSGAPVFTVANTGALQIQASSSAALDIRNLGGTSFFTVDASSGEVRVGPAAADANGVLFVLDTKNTAGDPAGVDGAQYYNSNLGKFRCFEGGIWVDCIDTDKTPQLRSFVDTTSDALINADGTDYWDTAAENNNAVPNITPTLTTRGVFGTVSVEFDTTSNGDRDSVVRVERAVGAAPVCGAGTIVGGKIGVFTSQSGARKTGTVTFLDEPATTSDVFYTVCSDADTSNAGGMSIPRIRVTLQEVENTN